MSWKKDERSEGYLDQLGCDYMYEQNIPMELLSPSWTTRNGPRGGKAILEDARDQYAARIKSGSHPPAVIVIYTAEGKLFPLDGRQRLSAAIKSGYTHFHAYVLSDDTAESTQDLIELGVNNVTNGCAPADMDYLVRRAADMHKQHGMSCKQIAEAIGVPEASIKAELTCDSERARLKRFGVKEWDTLAKWKLKHLSTVNDRYWQESTQEMMQFLGIMRGAKLTEKEARPWIRQIAALKKKAAPTTQLRGIIRDMKADPVVSAKLVGTKKRGDVAKILTNIKSLETVCKESKKKKVTATTEEAIAMLKHFNEIRRYLRFIVPQREGDQL